MEIKSKDAKKLLIFIAKAGGLVAVSMLAPMFPYMLLKSYLKSNNFNKRKFKNNIRTLESQGFIKAHRKGNEIKISITNKGSKKALEFDIFDMKLKKPKNGTGSGE